MYRARILSRRLRRQISIPEQRARSCANHARLGATREVCDGHVRDGTVHDGTVHDGTTVQAGSRFAQNYDDYRHFFKLPPASPELDMRTGQPFTVYGFLGKGRHLSKHLGFIPLQRPGGGTVQLRSHWEEESSAKHKLHKELRAIRPGSAVAATGILNKKLRPREGVSQPRDTQAGNQDSLPDNAELELALTEIQLLSPFAQDIVISKDATYPPSSRHLEMKFNQALKSRLDFRRSVKAAAAKFLDEDGFWDVETPMLFKSTPEGAREFLVPTREEGRAYALPQSPQQYKQILMACGIPRYYQFARCFRDEDLRADRQPEFTQLDLEMSFAKGLDVMRVVEQLVRSILSHLSDTFVLHQKGEEVFPLRWTHVPEERRVEASEKWLRFPDGGSDLHFPVLTYNEAMSLYGSDKPDLRIPGQIHRIEHILSPTSISKLTKLESPIIEACRICLHADSPKKVKNTVKKFGERLPKGVTSNPDGGPFILTFDRSRPMCGLGPLGQDGFERLTGSVANLGDLGALKDGDILLVQARQDVPFSGGSTAMGTLRKFVHDEAVECGWVHRDRSLRFLWVRGFPLFTPKSDSDPGQGGHAGFDSTHHPFTAPLTDNDFELLATDPLRVQADHYDLVVNGVELGGGSRRIHIAEVQKYVMKDILKMDESGIQRFQHLLDALRAGCPPHAGFAFGFDRLVAVLSGTQSVRDVIAFPKTMKGEDLMVKSPGLLTNELLDPYHLVLRKDNSRDG